ncbi:MAG TPA: glycosyltransferase family 39 protein, partial [Anaerolineales bacterium]|nr:glycosyltransferase family 39 protein [Anaerolineales bacterium]
MAKPLQRRKRLSAPSIAPANPTTGVWISIGLAIASIVMTLVALLTRRGSDSSDRSQGQKTTSATTTAAGGESIWSVLGAVLSALSAATLFYHLWQQRRETEIAPTTTEEDVEEIEPEALPSPATTLPVGASSPSLAARSTPSSATMTPALSNLAIRAPTQPVANRLSSAFTALSKQPGSATAVVVAISLGLLGLTHYILSLATWVNGDLTFLEPLQPLACIWPAFCDLRFPPYGFIALTAALIAAILFGAWLVRLRPAAFIAELSCKFPTVPTLRKFAQPPYLWFTLIFVACQFYVFVQAYRDQPVHPAVWVIGLAAALLLAWRADQGFVAVHVRDLLGSPTLWNLLYLTSILALLMTIAAITVERYWLAGLAGLLTVFLFGATLRREWPSRDWAARLERVSLPAVTALSFLLFSYGLNSWNWSFLGDEYSFYDLAKQFAQGTMTDAPLSGAGVYGYHPVLSSVWQGTTMWLFGETGYGWRVSHSLLLALSLPLFYYFLRPLIGRGGSFAAVILYGCAHVLLSFGKLGSNNVQVIWVMAASLAAFMWAARRGSLGGFVFTGILIGLGFYTFAVARVYSLIIAIWLTLYYFPFDLRLRRLNRANFAVWLAVVGAALLTALPVLSTRSAWAGQLEQTLFTSEYATAPYDRFLLLLRNTFYGLAAFLYYGQNAVFVAGAHADPITGSLMVLGLAALVATWRQGWRVRAALIASYALFVVIVAGTQQYNFPNITRTFAIAPFYALFAGVGLVALRAAFLSGVEGPLYQRVNALLKINAALIVAVVIPLNVWLSVDFSQKYSEQKMPAFLLQTAQMSGDETGRGPQLFYVGHPKYQFWIKTIYTVYEIPLDRVEFVFPRDALTPDNPICRAANEPAIVMIPAELENADYTAAQIQQCWPDASLK